MSARAGIVVTGTEVLTGRVSDRNGPWLAERLRELGRRPGVHHDRRDRPQDMLGALGFMAAQGLDLILTSGGLGPTADDLTAEVVAGFQGREMVLDEALEGRIAEILRPAGKALPQHRHGGDPCGQPQAGDDPGRQRDPRAGRHRTRPGRRAPARRAQGPRSWCCPVRRGSCSRCGGRRWQTPSSSGCSRARRSTAQHMLRLFGIPESEIAETLREAERRGVDLEQLEITTCLKRGEVEVVTRYEPGRRRPMTPSRPSCASATPTRCSPTTAAPSTCRSPPCCASAG